MTKPLRPAMSYRVHSIPAYATLTESHTLHEITAFNGMVTSGLCATAAEARQRIDTILDGRLPPTTQPDGQCNTAEMQVAWVLAQRIRGMAERNAIESALLRGVGTVEWAIASRIVVEYGDSLQGEVELGCVDR